MPSPRGPLSPLSRPARFPDEILADGTVLRPFAGREEIEACVALQRAVWGDGFSDLTSPALLRIVPELGGVAAGAFSPTGAMDAFVFGVTGLAPEDRSRPLHWSHMLAVRPQARGRDLGYRLKLYQRRALLALGIGTVRWTFDPLVSKNAYLNLGRLGARPRAYVRDYYGRGEDSALSAGIGTDRFVVEWALADPQVQAVIDGGGETLRLGEATHAPAVNTRPGGERPEPLAPPFPLPSVEPDGPRPVATPLRVEIPDDVQAVRHERPEAAAAWRASTRYAFEELLARGYRVSGFLRLPDPATAGARRSFYLLESP